MLAESIIIMSSFSRFGTTEFSNFIKINGEGSPRMQPSQQGEFIFLLFKAKLCRIWRPGCFFGISFLKFLSRSDQRG